MWALARPDKPAIAASVQAQYFRFFWPLALSSLIFALGAQLRNAALVRYPDGARELSTYAYAFSAYILLWAVNNFVPQMANAYARSERGHRVARNTVVLLNAVGALLLTGIANTRAGARFLSLAYHIEGRVLSDVQTYLRWFAPLLLVSGAILFHDGLLVQVKKTRFVTLARAAQVLATALVLTIGVGLEGGPLVVLVCSHYVGAAASLACLAWARARNYHLPAVREHEHVSYGEVIRFMLPTTITSVMFTLTRPIMYATLSRTAQPLVAVAALRIAYDLLASLQQVSNQFRHFFVTYGTEEDMAGKRAFMRRVGYALTFVLIVTLTPGPREIVFRQLLGVRDAVFEATIAAATALVAMPAVLMIRNYYHARLLAARAPNGMAVGAVLRVVLVAGVSVALLDVGRLTAQNAALSLCGGFVAEVVSSWTALRRVRA